MNLTARETDKLLAAMAAEVARKRLARGVKLNYAEAVALISEAVVEGARDGREADDLAQAATQVLAADQVMDGIAAMIREVEVEATFPDGITLVTVRDPIRGAAPSFVPGEVLTEAGDVEMNARRAVTEVEVENAGDRPIQVGSHYHFAEANPALRFDRDAVRGKRLDLVPGTFVRFEPGQRRTVRLIDVGGAQEIVGFRSEAAVPSSD